MDLRLRGRVDQHRELSTERDLTRGIVDPWGGNKHARRGRNTWKGTSSRRKGGDIESEEIMAENL